MVRKNLSRKLSHPQWKPVADPNTWSALAKQFQRLAGDPRDQGYHQLRAYAGPEDDWDKEALRREVKQYLASDSQDADLRRWLQPFASKELADDSRKGKDRATYKRTKRLLYALSGGYSEFFKENFKLVAIRAGRALGAQPGTEPETWLGWVFLDALEHNSKHFRCATPDGGGLILRICDVSATVCLRLEQWAVQEGTRQSSIREEQSEGASSFADEKRAMEPTPVPPSSVESNRTRVQQKQSGSKSPRSLNYRSELKGAIALVLARHPKADDRQVCHFLDDERLEIPDSLKTAANEQFFESVYLGPNRHRLESQISKVRVDMRNRGLFETDL